MDKAEEYEEIIIGNEKFSILLTEEEIQKRIKELADQINKDYQGKLPIFIGILNGSFLFMSDLIKNIDLKCEVDFFKLSSYGDEKISSGNVTLLKSLNADINDRHVIIVEDIVDSGLSINYIEKLLTDYKPSSVNVVTLLQKPESLKYDVKIDYIGFKIPNKFVIGYGLDYAQHYRNLRAIYALSE